MIINNSLSPKGAESAADRDKKKLQEAAEQFEAIFIQQILKEAIPEDGGADAELFGSSNALETYKSMYQTALSEEMAKSGGLGVKGAIMAQYADLYKDMAAKGGKSAGKDSAQIVDGDFRVSSDFGFRSDPFKGTNDFHYGVDLAAAEGTLVRSPVPGKVVFSGELRGYGNCVKIEDDAGKVYVFGHLKKNSVSEGDEVTKGTSIGEVGSTGKSTGPHLHFEVRASDGTAINPETLFSFNQSKSGLAKLNHY